MKAWRLIREDNQEAMDLHGQFTWPDEFDWQALAQSEGLRSLSGAWIVQQGLRTGGRPISLEGSKARISRGDLAKLADWSAVPELAMQLKHPDGRSFRVIFRRPALSNIEAVKAYRPADAQDSDSYRANIHLQTI